MDCPDGTCGALFARARHVLIDEYRVAVRIEQHKASGPGGRFVGFDRQREASTCQRSLDIAHIIVLGQRCASAIPAGIERQGVFVKHSLEKPDRAGFVLKDREVEAVAADDMKAELLVEIT